LIDFTVNASSVKAARLQTVSADSERQERYCAVERGSSIGEISCASAIEQRPIRVGEQDDRFLGLIDAAAGQAGLIVGNERDHTRAGYVGGRDNGEFVQGMLANRISRMTPRDQ
jgi:hypothetical protein